MLLDIERYGYAFVDGIEPTESATRRTLERIGYAKSTIFGDFWCFTVDTESTEESVRVKVFPRGVVRSRCLSADACSTLTRPTRVLPLNLTLMARTRWSRPVRSAPWGEGGVLSRCGLADALCATGLQSFHVLSYSGIEKQLYVESTVLVVVGGARGGVVVVVLVVFLLFTIVHFSLWTVLLWLLSLPRNTRPLSSC